MRKSNIAFKPCYFIEYLMVTVKFNTEYVGCFHFYQLIKTRNLSVCEIGLVNACNEIIDVINLCFATDSWVSSAQKRITCFM